MFNTSVNFHIRFLARFISLLLMVWNYMRRRVLYRYLERGPLPLVLSGLGIISNG